MLREIFNEVLEEYLAVKAEPMAGHPFQKKIKIDI